MSHAQPSASTDTHSPAGSASTVNEQFIITVAGHSDMPTEKSARTVIENAISRQGLTDDMISTASIEISLPSDKKGIASSQS